MSKNLDKIVTMLDFIDKILVMYSAISERVLVAPFMLTNDTPISSNASIGLCFALSNKFIKKLLGFVAK